jgi:hypothetical protein
MPVWLGLDGSYAHDSTAIAPVTFDTAAQKVRLVAHRIFIPGKDEPLDFGVVEEALLEMRRRFAVRQVNPQIRLAMSRTVAVETPRGVRISKSKASHRIDIIAALSFAALVAVREGQFRYEITYRPPPPPPRGRWDERPAGDSSRLFPRGESIAAAEDRGAVQLGRTWSNRWRRSSY